MCGRFPPQTPPATAQNTPSKRSERGGTLGTNAKIALCSGNLEQFLLP